jgi:hypothetical protein
MFNVARVKGCTRTNKMLHCSYRPVFEDYDYWRLQRSQLRFEIPESCCLLVYKSSIVGALVVKLSLKFELSKIPRENFCEWSLRELYLKNRPCSQDGIRSPSKANGPKFFYSPVVCRRRQFLSGEATACFCTRVQRRNAARDSCARSRFLEGSRAVPQREHGGLL